MPALRIQLLGPPAVYYDEKIVTIQRRMLRALLFYLACHDDPLDRAHLILIFWPDADESTGRRRIRESLSKLRAELPDPDLLVVNQDQVGLDYSRVDVDVKTFNELFQQCNRIANSIPRHLPLPEQVHQTMRKAIEKWHSSRFMAGALLPKSLDLDNWLAETGNQMERRRMMLIDRLSDHYAATGDFESAISWLNTILEEDPHNPAWQVRYLSWLQQLGRRSEAQTYSKNLQQFYEEMGEPLPEELQSLTVKSQKHEMPEWQGMESPFWPPLSILQTIFVGRYAEMQSLNTAFQRGGVALILGESGTGKTRLVYEFSQQYARNQRLLVASCRSSTKHLPYQPLLEMLRHSVTEKEWESISPMWLAPLAQLMPELNQYLSQPSRFEDTYLDNAQNVIFECLHQVLQELTRPEKLLLFLDDAHAADQTTLDTLAYLVGCGFFEQDGLLVLAARLEDPNPALTAFYENLQKSSLRYVEIQMAELGAEDAAGLVSSVLGQEYPKEIVKRLLENASGQPLHLIETLRALLEYSPDINLVEVIDHLPLPRSILELVQRKMNALSPQGLKVLQIIAVASGSVSPALIEKASGLEPERVVQALEELEYLRLVQATSTKSRGVVYHFQYGRIRKAVLVDISAARKRLIRLSLAQAMQSLPVESNNPSLIAQYYEDAGELKSAFENWVKAGIKTAQMFSTSETKLCFGNAAALLQHLGIFVSDQEIYQLFFVWGDYLDDTGDFNGCLRLYHELQSIGNQRQSDLLLGIAFNGLCRAHRRLDEYAKSIYYNDLALKHLEHNPSLPEYLYAWNRRAVTLTLQGEYGLSLAALHKALDLSQKLNERRVQIGISGVFLQIASIWQFKGLPQRSIEITDLAERAIFSSINDPDIEMLRITRAQAFSAMGFPRKAYNLCNQVILHAQEWNNKRLEAFAKMAKSFAALVLGQMDDSLNNVEDALAIAEQFKYFHISQQSYCVLGDIYRLCGEYERSIHVHRKALEHPTRSYYRLDNEIRVAYNYIRLGELDRGLALLKDAQREAEENEFGYIALTGRIMQVNALILQNKVDEAEALIQTSARDSEEKGVMVMQANIALYGGYCAWKKGHSQEAMELLDHSLSITQGNENVWQENAALRVKYQILIDTGQDTEPVEKRLTEIRDHILRYSKRPDLQDIMLQAFDQGRTGTRL